MKKWNFIIVLLAFPMILLAQNVKQEDIPTDVLVDSAIVKMDKGEIEASRCLLESAISNSPNHFRANYELAYLYTMLKQYDLGIKVLKNIEGSKDVTDRYYQLLGTLYDYKGMTDLSIEKYKEGIVKFPNSGRLYVELGMMHHKSNNVMKALNYYELGILADPMFSSNYYYAGLVLLNSSEPVWGLMYGEIFMNLEPHTERSKTMSKYMFETIKTNVCLTDTAFVASFTKENQLQFDSSSMSLEMPFPLLYQTCFNSAGRKAIEEGLDTLEIYTVGKIHEYQIEHGKMYYNINCNDPLYIHLLQIQNAGFMEAYCMHLYHGGAISDYFGWLSMNKDYYMEFFKWLDENKLQLYPNHCFSRLTCKPVNLSQLNYE